MALTLKAARVNAGLTQAEAAKQIGISTATLFNYENGTSYPDVPVLKRIEQVYGVEYKNIFFLGIDPI